ncbi:MAG TPA: hypothetical protein VNX60_11400 [Candidatus Acidoferrum sp.]|nr:hypothetical protein [Candidatus Acidoferrum sp.]
MPNLASAALLTTAAAAAPKIHVIITFGKWMSAQWFKDSSANRKPLTLKVRALVIDGRHTTHRSPRAALRERTFFSIRSRQWRSFNVGRTTG